MKPISDPPKPAPEQPKPEPEGDWVKQALTSLLKNFGLPIPK